MPGVNEPSALHGQKTIGNSPKYGATTRVRDRGGWVGVARAYKVSSVFTRLQPPRSLLQRRTQDCDGRRGRGRKRENFRLAGSLFEAENRQRLGSGGIHGPLDLAEVRARLGLVDYVPGDVVLCDFREDLGAPITAPMVGVRCRPVLDHDRLKLPSRVGPASGVICKMQAEAGGEEQRQEDRGQGFFERWS